MPIILDPVTAVSDAAFLGPVQRILRGVSATLGHSFTSDGSVIDPGTATVSITASDGTVLVAAASATEAVSGVFTYTLTPVQTAQLDTLRVVWTATIGGQVQSLGEFVEVVGGFVFTIADARNYSGLNAQNNDLSYRISTARIVAARTEVEQALEQELCFAMVPRYSYVTLDGTAANTLALSPYPRVIRTATVDGTALVPADLAMSPYGAVYNPVKWADGFQNVTIGYEHGLDSPPPRAKDVALALCRRALTGSPADDRATSMSTDQETTTFYVPGASEPFDVPAANRFVTANSLRTGIA